MTQWRCGCSAQVLSPGVQDRQEADAGAQMLWVGGNLQQCVSNRVEQHVVDDTLVAQGKSVERVGECEHDVEVLDGQQFLGAIRHPLAQADALAPRAVPVAAGVVGDALVVAVITLLDMSAQGGGAAGSDRAQDAPLFRNQIAEPMPVTLNDLCQLQRRTLDRHHVVGGVIGGCGCG